MHGKKEERYERILTEAARLFAEKGYEQTTISDIVKACDMARGTFYLYFESLEGVLTALFSDVMSVVWAEVERIIQQNQETDLKEIIRAIFRLVTERRELLTVFHCGGGQAFNEFKYRSIRDNLGLSVARLIRQGQESGTIRSCSPELVAMMITSLIDQMAYYTVVLEEDAQTKEKVVDELVGFIMYGTKSSGC